MAEMRANKDAKRLFSARYRGRFAQTGIFLARQLAMFTYQSDWKVLPMSALIAGLIGMVVRKRLFITMEGTLLGGFAMVMVCIWNGCFNSIQVVCRERDVIKREHRSGMHISSYVASHMLYQALLCLLQTVVTLYVTRAVGVQYPEKGLFTPWMIADFGISVFLITYAADMMSLWISSLARNTTTAMTIMPFVLIFQLVFSGGLLALPGWTQNLVPLTISNPALKVVAAQGDYNNRPMMLIWDQLNLLRDRELSATIHVGDILDALKNEEIPAIKELRDTQLTRVFTLGEVKDLLDSPTFQPIKDERVLEDMSVADLLRFVRDSEYFESLRDVKFHIGFIEVDVAELLNKALEDPHISKFLESRQVTHSMTVGDLMDAIDVEGMLDRNREVQLGKDIYVRDVMDLVLDSEYAQSLHETDYTISTTVGGVVEMIGEDRVREILQDRVADASRNEDYALTKENISKYWLRLGLFVLIFAALSTITLEFIDKDKR